MFGNAGRAGDGEIQKFEVASEIRLDCATVFGSRANIVILDGLVKMVSRDGEEKLP